MDSSKKPDTSLLPSISSLSSFPSSSSSTTSNSSLPNPSVLPPISSFSSQYPSLQRTETNKLTPNFSTQPSYPIYLTQPQHSQGSPKLQPLSSNSALPFPKYQSAFVSHHSFPSSPISNSSSSSSLNLNSLDLNQNHPTSSPILASKSNPNISIGPNLLNASSNQTTNASLPSSSYLKRASSERTLPKAHVSKACNHCKRAHLACDHSRPCRRCVALGKADTCVDLIHKKRGRPRIKKNLLNSDSEGNFDSSFSGNEINKLNQESNLKEENLSSESNENNQENGTIIKSETINVKKESIQTKTQTQNTTKILNIKEEKEKFQENPQVIKREADYETSYQRPQSQTQFHLNSFTSLEKGFFFFKLISFLSFFLFSFFLISSFFKLKISLLKVL